MAATKRNRSKPTDPLFKRTREKIKVAQLVDRLENNALGTLKKNSGKVKGEDYEEEYIEMTTGQLRSAEILLNKTMPNLQTTELSGPEGGAIQTEAITRTIVDPKGK